MKRRTFLAVGTASLAALAFGYFASQSNSPGRIMGAGRVVAVSDDRKKLLVRGVDNNIYFVSGNSTSDWTNVVKDDRVVIYGEAKDKITDIGYMVGDYKVDSPVVKVQLDDLKFKYSGKAQLQKKNLNSFGDFTYDGNLEARIGERQAYNIWSYTIAEGETPSGVAEKFNREDKSAGDLRLNATINDIYRKTEDGSQLVPVGPEQLRQGDIVCVVPKPPR